MKRIIFLAALAALSLSVAYAQPPTYAAILAEGSVVSTGVLWGRRRMPSL